LNGLRQFKGRTLLILSGEDLTAKEFRDFVRASPQWQQALAQPRVATKELVESNHTFASRAWRDQVFRWTAQWLKSW